MGGVPGGLQGTGKGFVWARGLELFVGLGEAEAVVEAAFEGNGDEIPAGAAEGPVDQKRIW